MSKNEGGQPGLPVDFMPVSNGEFWPLPAMPGSFRLMEAQERIGQEARRRLGMSRREFVRSAAGLAAGFAAIGELARSSTAYAHHIDPCEADPTVQLDNLPGEFIFDIQTHMVDVPAGLPHPPPYRGDEVVANFFNNSVCASDPPADGSGANIAWDPNAVVCSDRVDYIRMIHLESPTDVACISVFPSQADPGDPNPEDLSLLPAASADCTCDAINDLASSRRSVFHHFVMPNHQKGGSIASEVDLMQEVARNYGRNLGGWKLYPMFGDNFTVDSAGQIQLGTTPGYLLTSQVGRKALERALSLGNRPVCVHKGIMFSNFQSAYGGTWDIAQAARDYPGLRIMVYHSGWYTGPAPSSASMQVDGSPVPVPAGFEGSTWKRFYEVSPPGHDPVVVPAGVVHTGGTDSLGNPTYVEFPGPYPLDQEDRLSSLNTASGTDGLIKAVREAGWSGGDPGSGEWPNHPSVYAELGGVWNFVGVGILGFNPIWGQCAAAHFLGKLIRHLGPRRVVWGTDCVWSGSPMAQIARLRRFPEPYEVYARYILEHDYGLPHGLDGDVDDPTSLPSDPSKSIRNAIFGRNAAQAYGINVGRRNPIACEDVAAAASTCDGVAALRHDVFTRHPGTPRETRVLADNRAPGYRSVGRMLADLIKGQFH